MDSDETFSGTWIIVSTAGGKYIGRVANTSTFSHDDMYNKTDVLCELEKKNYICLNPAFDFECVLREHQGNIAKGKLISSLDSNALTVNCYINLTGARITFFDDMHESDKREYKELVRYTLKQMEQVRASRAGITLATGNPKP